jgi:hypothetical protein
MHALIPINETGQGAIGKVPSDYDVMRDEIVPLLKDCADNLNNFMSAQAQDTLSRTRDQEAAKLMTKLEITMENLGKQFTAFIAAQGTYEARQRDLELKVTRMMAYGGAGVTIVSLLVHLLGH